MSKVILILVDGMRPDGVEAANHPFLAKLKAHSAYTLEATTVMPSVTLPCHMSLFHSVTPQRHGILSNTYVPQVRPIKGLFEVLRMFKKTNGFFYNWEELKDLGRPDSLGYANYISGHIFGYDTANKQLTDNAISFINAAKPDFTFLYLGNTDEVGHAHGWMGKEYIASIYDSFDCIEKVVNSIPEDYYVIVTADHGGHDRSHGTPMHEDMTIPLFLYNSSLEGHTISQAGILDIAPTIVTLCGVPADDDWEGNSLV